MGLSARSVPRTARRPAYPADYHDYVFRDGKLIGDFDNMYRHAKDVPWDQDTRCDRWYAAVGMAMLREHGPYRSVLEIGCGLGYIAAKLRLLTGTPRDPVDAFDVSPNAIRTARRLHPDVRFYVDDVRGAAFRPKRQYELVVVRELLWYVADALETVLSNVAACVQPSGWLYVGQSFPALDGAFVGKRVLPDPEALLRKLAAYEPVYTARLRNHRLTEDGPILHFLGRKRS